VKLFTLVQFSSLKALLTLLSVIHNPIQTLNSRCLSFHFSKGCIMHTLVRLRISKLTIPFSPYPFTSTLLKVFGHEIEGSHSYSCSKGRISWYSLNATSARFADLGLIEILNGCATRTAPPANPAAVVLVPKGSVFGSNGFPVTGSLMGLISKAHKSLLIARQRLRSARCMPGQIRRPPP
jgi:hypothetical protein